MPVLSGFDSNSPYRGGFVSIGNFDGVHCGHQAMISTLVKRARALSVPAVAITFDPHPTELLRPSAIPSRLTTIAHRAELLQHYGVDFVIVIPTTPEFLNLTAEEFFESIIRTELQARGLVEGPNFYFGKNRSGSVTVLRQFCAHHQLSLDIIPPVVIDEQLVSSSVIRSLIEAGDLTDSVQLLGHPYRLTGTVTTGAQRGRTIGFPTANLAETTNLIPANGVYAAVTSIGGRAYAAAVNIGPNPTFAENQQKIEVHLWEFAGDLYGQVLHVDFLSRVREVRRFENIDALRSQLQIDLEAVKQEVARHRANA